MMIVKNAIRKIQHLDVNLIAIQQNSLFSAEEQHYCLHKANPAASLTGMWCAKTALTQAVAQVPHFPAYAIAEVEIQHEQSGRPIVQLSDRLQQWCHQQGITFALSISHAGEYAAASVLMRSH